MQENWDSGGDASQDASSNDVSPEYSPITSGPVHDWEEERSTEFFDDGTMTYFWGQMNTFCGILRQQDAKGCQKARIGSTLHIRNVYYISKKMHDDDIN
ncbi:hypothetical protein Pcinc_026293 [Petrolisthes cinctipes]|uniref:Uncharacterized protein n=1 Tax=Petrolisthes cinctipes TaxID=88211 RepID=A0AAE1K8B0_PETCI|nr:hypothetical protein Pcinc_026293 [Petrolisthes cinctipes]